MEKKDPPIIIETIYQNSIEEVWSALTEPDKMKQWFFQEMPDFQAKVGFETSFPIIVNGRTYTHQWKIREVIPLQKISYNWNYKEYSGDGHITFELFEKTEGTLIRLTDIITKSYPDDIPEFKRESGVEGWTYLLKERLAGFLTNHERPTD